MDKPVVTFNVESKDVMSVTSASKELGVNRVTVYRWVASGRLFGVKFADTLYIPVKEVARLKAS